VPSCTAEHDTRVEYTLTDEPRRIAFCITELDPGGAERALLQIASRLDRNKWEPLVISLSGPGKITGLLEAQDITVRCLNARSRWDIGVLSRLRAQLREFRPDVLQTFLFHANIAGRVAARRLGIPVVVSGVRVVETDARWRMQVDRMTNRLVTHNVCVSKSVEDQYRQLGVSADRLSVIPNGVDLQRFEAATPADLAQFDVPTGARTVLTIGRLHRQKGIDALIQAMRDVMSEAADIHLLIAGEGAERDKLQQLAAEAGYGARIHFVGWSDDVPSLLHASDLFVLASRWEGMPNVLLEAMAARRPVVATDVEGVRECVEDGRSGVIVPPDDAAALSTAIAGLLADPERATSLAAAAQAQVRQHFTWQATTDQYVALWYRLLASNANRVDAG